MIVEVKTKSLPILDKHAENWDTFVPSAAPLGSNECKMGLVCQVGFEVTLLTARQERVHEIQMFNVLFRFEQEREIGSLLVFIV
jgi:hypothetical protein